MKILPAQGMGRILRLTGPLVLATLFDFRPRYVRTLPIRSCWISPRSPRRSAGIGALVGAYVTHQKDGRSLYLIGVSQRVQDALQVTRVKQFFHFVDSVAAVEQAS